MWVVPMIGSPPMPMAVEKPISRSFVHHLVGQRGRDLETSPILPGAGGMSAGDECPGAVGLAGGEMIPGQFRADDPGFGCPWPPLVRPDCRRCRATGIPSVITTASGDARRRWPPRSPHPWAKRGRDEQHGHVRAGLLDRLLHRAETRSSPCRRWSPRCRPWRGVHPAHDVWCRRPASWCCALVPSPPVMPCTMTLLVLVQKDRHSVQAPPQPRGSAGLVGPRHPSFLPGVTSGWFAVVENPPALLDVVVAVQPDHQRLGRLAAEDLQCFDDPRWPPRRQAVIPPKTLTNTLRTSGSPRMTSQPWAAITSAEAPPPMSRKLAGLTPLCRSPA